ncbi:hydroxymethylglutaryl-CoA reductase, degradative [Kitasatospora sp. NPDC048540]|uniref:hydroxymethylglutaryl-CoA reductase, degradative n=1 Tax=unclassified Kitasatospora TaxID=2633591 RepID=UPI00068D5083|nr:hydroxymethylglutaryl-CoA reductase, degradative [Kitasatospora sp. MBT63]
MTSRHPGFHRLPLRERARVLAEAARLSRHECELLASEAPLALSTADLMIENAVGVFALPYGVAVNFTVNGRDRLVPMVTEEPSVVAAASNAARLTRACGGVSAEADPSLMTGQIHVLEVPDAEASAARVHDNAGRLVAAARRLQPRMVARGGGACAISAEALPDGSLLVHVVADVGDAMGANAVNTLVEALTPEVLAVTGGVPGIRILSNLADRRLARARVSIPDALLATAEHSGAQIAGRIVAASSLAEMSPHRATTHNKGIMNGIDAVALATGQDWRAIEAGAHAHAARTGRYRPIAVWEHEDGRLNGTFEAPLAVGTVGERIRANPRATLSLRLLEVSGARELAAVMAAVGLAQNLAALRALAGEGIQRGHMALHHRCRDSGPGTPP